MTMEFNPARLYWTPQGGEPVDLSGSVTKVTMHYVDPDEFTNRLHASGVLHAGHRSRDREAEPVGLPGAVRAEPSTYPAHARGVRSSSWMRTVVSRA
jgi:hypothetical protein